MGQSLSLAGVERTRDAILLALRSHFSPAGSSRASPLSAHALAAFRRLDPDSRGWIASSSLDAAVESVGLSQRWSRLEIDAFARCFVVQEDPELSYGAAPTSSRLDYELFLDVVFFPVTMASYEAKKPTKRLLQLTQYAVVLRKQFGCVVHGGMLGDREVTVKEAQLKGHDPQRDDEEATQLIVERLRRVVNGLRLAEHPNLIRFKASVQSKESLFIVEEAFPSCSLHTILASFGPMKEATIRRYMVQVLEALEYLHARDVVHGCLCMESINIDSCGLLKLSDFGIGADLRSMRWSQTPNQAKTDDNGPEMVNQYPPPESASGVAPSKAGDVWCVGVLILQMAQGLHNTMADAQSGRSVEGCDNNSLHKTPKPPATGPKPSVASSPPIPASMSKQLRDVVRACLQPGARKRPTVSKLLELEFFQIDHSQSTNELLRDVCSDLDASMKRLTTTTSGRPSFSNSSSTSIGYTARKQPQPQPQPQPQSVSAAPGVRPSTSMNRCFSSNKPRF